MVNEEITKLESELESTVKKESKGIIESIALSLRNCFERSEYITPETPHFWLMQKMGLVPLQHSSRESCLHHDTLIFDPTQKARGIYLNLKDSGYYTED